MWKPMFLQCIVFSVLLQNIFAQSTESRNSVVLEVKSASQPHFYQGEAATFTCIAKLTDFEGLSEVSLYSGTDNVGCIKSKDGWKSSARVPTGSPLEGYSMPPETCDAIMSNPSEFSLVVQKPLSAGGVFRCEAYSFSKDETIKSNEVSVTDLRIAPTDLTISINSSDDTIVTGDYIAVSCSSQGGVPESKFVYGLMAVGAGMQAEGTDDNVFSVTTGEHEVWCTDDVHKSYQGGQNAANHITKSIVAHGLELSSGGGPRELNPEGNNVLDCSVSDNARLPADAVTTVTWMRNGSTLPAQTGFILTVPLDDDTTDNQLSVTYDCTVSVTSETLNRTLESSRTFPVTWSEQATMPPTTKPTEKPKDPASGPSPSKQASIDPGIIAAVIIAALVLIIVIIVIVVCIKRRAGASKDIKSENRATVKDKIDEEKGDPNANKSGSTDNGTNNTSQPPKEIIYAEIDLTGQKPASPASKRDEPVHYAAIDHTKTQNYKNTNV